MIRRPPRSTRTDTLVPYTTRCRSWRDGPRRRMPLHLPRLRQALHVSRRSRLVLHRRRLTREDPTVSLAERVRADRSEERLVGKECVSSCRSRWSPNPSKKKKRQNKLYKRVDTEENNKYAIKS